MRSQQRHRGSHPQARPARCIVYIFKIACKVSGRELELPLEDPSPSADLILRQPQQRTEFERTKTREGGRRAKPPHKGREPLGSHASRPPPVQRPLPALELKLDFFFFFQTPRCAEQSWAPGRLLAYPISRETWLQREKEPLILSLAHPLLVSGQLSTLPPSGPRDSPLHHWNGCINKLVAGFPRGTNAGSGRGRRGGRTGLRVRGRGPCRPWQPRLSREVELPPQ